MLVLDGFHDGDTHFLGEAAGESLGALLVQGGTRFGPPLPGFAGEGA
jgi:hypothetical protein